MSKDKPIYRKYDPNTFNPCYKFIFTSYLPQFEKISCWNSKEMWSTNAAPEEPHPRSTRRRARDAAARARDSAAMRRAASCHVVFFFLANLRRLAPTQADSRLIRPTQAEMVDSSRNSKKNKKVQNGLFELNIKPYFSSLHTHTPNFSSLTLSLSITRLSLSLCSLPLSLLAVKHSTSAESVTWLTSVHSFFSSFSCILNSGIDIKLSI